MKTTCCLALLMLLHVASSQISFYPMENIQTLPRFGMLTTVHILHFGLLPATLERTDYLATWTLPDGEMVSEISQSANLNILVQQGLVVAAEGVFLNGTILTISDLSFMNAGVYRCSVQDLNEQGSPPTEIQIELQLLASLTAIEPNVVTLDNASSVELRCEMGDYVRPDNRMQWFKDGEMIVSGQNRRSTIVINGEKPAANGAFNLSISRISILTILDPILSDSGTYECRVIDTEKTVQVQLQVQSSLSTVSTDASTTPTSTTDLTDEVTSGTIPPEFPLPVVIGSIAAVLGVIVIALIIVIAVVTVKRRRLAKQATVIPSEFQDNGAYACTSNGGSHTGSMAVIPNYPTYSKLDKTTPPPLPARPATNLSISVGNSVNSIDPEPPGYATPEVPQRKEISGTYNPYYDDPDHLKAGDDKFFAPPLKKKTYYDDVDIVDGVSSVSTPNPYDMTTVPSPADVLSMPRTNTSNRNPDFSYPIYNDGIPISDFNTDHDYDQIYSEPIDPSLLRGEIEYEAGSQEAIPYSAIYEDPLPLQEGAAPLVIAPENIQEVKDLGMGQFGNVLLARTVDLSLVDLRLSETDTDRNISILVAIKKLKLNAETSLTESFNKEVKFMARLMHDNVIRLLGVCKGAESFIMMEYMENGDLNQFLQKQRLMPDTISGLQENEVTPIILLYIGVQIASGMHYLASHRFVHRDLATRNCLVGKDFVVKISDFGMSRSLYESAYYRVQGTLVLPIRWMACETFYGKFSVKSDAWAFGVVLWEIYTLAKVDPYDHLTDEEVIADAIRGPDRVLPIKPEKCLQEVYDIMLRCWVHEPSMRADFGEIYSRLFMIYTRQAL